MESKTTALDGQTLVDLTLQETGTLSGLFELAMANGKSITDVPEPGEKLKRLGDEETGRLGDGRILNYYKAHDIRPVTRLAMGPESTTLFEDGLYDEGLFE